MAFQKAITTLVVGDVYQDLFKRYCLDNWRQYAQKHGYDLVVFDKPLDNADRARNRFISWQKCLVFSHPQLRKYRRVVWVDADTMINVQSSPCICEGVPVDKVGAVDERSWPSRTINPLVFERLYKDWERRGLVFWRCKDAAEYYARGGFPPDFDRVVQAGVMVASPASHAELFQRVYDIYDETGGPETNFELRNATGQLRTSQGRSGGVDRFAVQCPLGLRQALGLSVPFQIGTGLIGETSIWKASWKSDLG